MPSIPPDDLPPGWRMNPAQIAFRQGDIYELIVRSGTTPDDLATLIPYMGAAVYVDDHRDGDSDTDVALTFRRTRDDTAPQPARLGWTPNIAEIIKGGPLPHQMAMYELISAADDPVTGAHILNLVTQANPADVVALAAVFRDRHDQPTANAETAE